MMVSLQERIKKLEQNLIFKNPQNEVVTIIVDDIVKPPEILRLPCSPIFKNRETTRRVYLKKFYRLNPHLRKDNT